MVANEDVYKLCLCVCMCTLLSAGLVRVYPGGTLELRGTGHPPDLPILSKLELPIVQDCAVYNQGNNIIGVGSVQIGPVEKYVPLPPGICPWLVIAFMDGNQLRFRSTHFDLVSAAFQ